MSRKREIRLLKNREAARECRRKKKEYIKCLENRYSAVQYSAVHCSAVQYSAVQYSAVQYSAVQCSAVQCSTVQVVLTLTSSLRWLGEGEQQPAVSPGPSLLCH